MVHAVTTLQRSVRIVQLGLILFMILFSRFLGVSRKQISFGISLGFGLFAGVELMLMALNSGGFVKQGIAESHQHRPLPSSRPLSGSAIRFRRKPSGILASIACRPSAGNKAWPICNTRSLPIP